MDDYASKSSSSLVVAEKNVHKPGGCVGIFCRLFDWNRRFAKKKLFPKKLLAPARGNKVSKKFTANENLLKTKHLLTDDANGGGIGNLSKHEMSSPGLVARLMGLDSLPVVKRQSKNVGFVERSVKEVANLEKQPQKIQKTGLFERRPVNRFGADAMHIRNVLSRSKKRHPKLALPAKSPRGAKSTSRLIGAATRILEPGLQATSRAKCTLTYSNSMPQQPMKDEVMRRAKTLISLPVQSTSQAAMPQDLNAQSSCRNCGHALEGMDFTAGAIEQNPTLDMPTCSIHKALFDSVDDRKRSVATRCDRESEVVLLRSQYQPQDLTDQGLPFALNGKKHSGLNSNSFIPRSTMANMYNKSVSSTTAFNDKKDFIAMNRNVSQQQFRFPRKPQYQVPDAAALSTEGNIVTKRTSSVCRHVECSSSSSSVVDRENTAGRRLRFGCNSFVQGGNVPNGSKDIDYVSCCFNSPLKSPSRSLCATQMDQSNFINGDISQQILINGGNHGVKSMSPLLMDVDALGTVLAHKLKELATQGENESTAATPQGRTATAILQELISALTAERPISPELNDSVSSDAAMTYSRYRPSQADARGKRVPARFSGNHSSPGSVLDASFSNDSCVSSSIDDSSGNMLQSDFADLSLDDPQSLHSDRDFYDSETSFNNKETGCNVPVSHLLDHISRALERTNLPDMKLSTAYSAYTKEVLFNCELLFGNADGSETFVDFLVGPFLDELETLAVAAWRNTVISGFQVSKGGGDKNPLRRFLLDCLVECLSIRYDRYSNSGFMEWCRLPRELNAEALIGLFDYEVRKSASLARMNLYEIIIWEMNASLAKWADFELEMFEAGAEICMFIFHGLVDEIVAEFLLSS